eukprot:2153904-Amphidinium_carterae.4
MKQALCKSLGSRVSVSQPALCLPHSGPAALLQADSQGLLYANRLVPAATPRTVGKLAEQDHSSGCVQSQRPKQSNTIEALSLMRGI